MKSVKSQLLRWWTLVAMMVLAVQAVAAKKPKDEAPSQSCEVYPIALSLSSVSNISTGAVLSNLRTGTKHGQFGWLSWSGSRSAEVFVKSLTAPGDSHTYVNPMGKSVSNAARKAADDDDNDYKAGGKKGGGGKNKAASGDCNAGVDVRDWVRSTRSNNGRSVRTALDQLKNRDIIVPLWYQTLGREEQAVFRIAGFAKVRLLSYDLAGEDTITVQYVGMVNPRKGNQAPVVYAGEDQVIAFPSRASLNGSVIDDGLPANKEVTSLWTKVGGPGEVSFADSAAAATTASFSEPGTYLLRLTGSDSSKSASDEVVVTVNYANAVPVANSQTLSTLEDVAVSVMLTGTDADGDPLTFYVLSNPSFGTLSGAAPNLVYTPAPNVSGTDSFTFKVNDGVLDSAVATVVINVAPVNDPPVAYGQSVSTDEDAPLTVVLGGYDPEGTALIFTVLAPPANGTLSGTPPNLLYTPAANHFGSDQFTFQVDDGVLSSAPVTVTITVRPVNDAPLAQSDTVSLLEDGVADVMLHGTDVEGSVLTFSIVTPPAHGAITGTPPAVRYVPAANYNGEDSFTFKVNDGALDSAPAVVTIAVQEVNDAPVALNDAIALDEDSTANIVLRGADVEGASLSFTILNPPTQGVLNGTPPNVQYVPAANYNGGDSFTFLVNDGSLDSAPATVSLTVREVNDAPVAADLQVSLDEDTSLDLVLTGSDVEGSALMFSLVDAPAHGSLTGTLPNVSYVPNANYNGADVFTFKVNDGELDSPVGTVSLTVAPVNDVPVASPQDLQAVELESTPITLAGSDVDDDPLTFEVVSGPANGTLSGTPPNLSYTPNPAGRPETDSFTFAVSDGVVSSTLATVTIDIIYNQPPVVSAGPDRVVRSTTDVITLAGSASDDGLPRNSSLQLTWQMKFGPGVVTFGNAGSAVTTASFSAEGLYILELTATDSQYTSSDLVEVRVAMICAANPSGAVAWWPANFNSVDVVAGNVVEGAIYGSGQAGPGFVFDGVDDQMRAAASASLDLGAADTLTVEFWMNSADVLRSVRLLGWHSGLDVFPQDQGVNIFQSSGALHVQLYDTNNVSREMVAFNSLVNNTWTHVAVTYDRNAGQGRIYVNGALRTTSNLGSFRPRTTFPLFFGKILNDTVYFQGALDEVTLYTRALDAQEIYEIYAANGIGKCPLSPNSPPVVNAGPDVYLQAPGVGTLNGLATDDGLPAPGSLRAAWSVVSAPGNVTFTDSGALSTTASFDAPGIYVLRLSVDDSEIVRSDVMEVRVAAVCMVKNLPSLAAWWPGNGNANDVLGGREGRLAGGTSFANGRVGGAFSFDGVNDSVRTPGDSGLDVGAGPGFSIELWVNSADIARNARLVAYHNGIAANGTNVGVNVFQMSGNVHAQLPEVGGTVREFVALGALTANTWTHIVVTYDRTRGLGRTYVNGVQRVVSNAGSFVARTVGNVHLGNLPFDVNHFRGLLDEVSIYNRTLDAQEVNELFAAGAVGKCPNDGNQGPIVNAGPDLHLRDTSQPAALNGTVTDDGLPPGYPVRSLWSVVNGPGSVTFADATAAATTATFSAPGTYVLRLTADDALIAVSDLVEVRVAALCTVKDPPGLVAWWPANANANDAVGVNHARLAGGASFASGKVSSAFQFDGSNDVVQVSADPSLNVGQGEGLTFEFWVNSTDVVRFARLVGFHFGFGTLGTNFGVNVFQQSGGVSAQIYDVAGVSRQFGPAASSLVSNVWTHVAVTYDRTTGMGRIYIDGALRTTSNLGIFTPRTSYNLYFGNLPSDSGFFRGMLDEVSLYGRALDAQEVYDIYSSGAGGKCPKDQNTPPVVNAGPDLELPTVADVATLNGSVTDDGLPAGAGLRVNWSLVDGPGTVTFADASAAVTTATFTAPGIYVLSLTADDAAVVRNDLIEVRVAVSCSATASGLVAWWPGNGHANDVTGGNHGRLAGGATFASGRVSAAFRFDGTNDAVHVPAHPSLDVGLGGGFTLEFWINPADVTRNARLVGWHSGVGATGTNFGVNVQMLGRTVNAQIYDLAGAPHDVSVFSVLTNNVWTHVAVTYDQSAALGRVYINGVLRNTVAVGSYTARTSYRFFMGNVPFDPNFFRGLLDEVSIYNRPLALDEIAAVFAAGADGKCPPAPVAPASIDGLAASEPAATVTENDSGQRIGMTDASGGTTYTYDAAGRVTRIDKAWSAHAGAPAFETSLVYEYDELGRFVGVHSTSVNGASMGYLWSDANQLLEVADPHVGRTVYNYDTSGKAVSYTYPDGVTGSTFGVLDNVACYEEAGATIVCDADGNRVRRTVSDGSRTVTTYYVVSPLTVTGAAQVVEELTFDSADPLFATAAITRVYVHGLHTISKEELVNGEWQLYFFE